jgi:hypothetical protein
VCYGVIMLCVLRCGHVMCVTVWSCYVCYGVVMLCVLRCGHVMCVTVRSCYVCYGAVMLCVLQCGHVMCVTVWSCYVCYSVVMLCVLLVSYLSQFLQCLDSVVSKNNTFIILYYIIYFEFTVLKNVIFLN